MEIYFSVFLGLLKKQREHEKEEKRINKYGHVQGGGGQPGKMAKQKAEKAATMAFKVEDESREKLISAVLTGVNRAFPFAKTDDARSLLSNSLRISIGPTTYDNFEAYHVLELVVPLAQGRY